MVNCVIAVDMCLGKGQERAVLYCFAISLVSTIAPNEHELVTKSMSHSKSFFCV